MEIQSTLFLLKILQKLVLCTQRVITEIMMGSETKDIISELFKSLLQNYQEGLQESMRGSEFIFDSADFLYYHLRKINLSRGRSYINSPKW